MDAGALPDIHVSPVQRRRWAGGHSAHLVEEPVLWGQCLLASQAAAERGVEGPISTRALPTL